MADAPVLVAVSGERSGTSWPITTDGLRIGRDAQMEVHVDDPAVSRQHARVLLHNGAVWVQDSGSRNGVFVNGDRVSDNKQVKPGDQLTIGTHTFRVNLGESLAATPAPKVPPKKGSLLPYLVAGMGLAIFGGLALVVLVAIAWGMGVFG